MAELHLNAPFSSDLYQLGCRVRETVFIKEQGVSAADEWDGRDPDAAHFVTLLDGSVVAVLRVLWLPEHAKIGRFAVLQQYREQGIGSRLFEFTLSSIRHRNQTQVMLEAQSGRIDFYERFGFCAYGDEYWDAGILHREMKNY